MLPSSNTASTSRSVPVNGPNPDPMVHPRVAVGMCATLVASFLVSSVHAVDVDGVITVDNAYGFAFGDVNGITTSSYYGGLRNTNASEIANGAPVLFSGPTGPGFTNPGVGPELYDLPSLAPPDYMYLIAWSDDSSYQGAIGSFTVGSTSVGTLPNTGWEVFATGIDLDSTVASDTLTTDPADVQLINDQIAIANANAGNAGTSLGWVDDNGMLPNGSLGLGELVFSIDDNTGGSGGQLPFGAIQGIPSNARWMWYNEDPVNISNPFGASSGGGPDGHKEFLIFRIQVADVLQQITGCCCWFDDAGNQVQSQTSEADCHALSGIYAGDGVDCEDFNCQQITGACCFLKDFGVMWCHDNYNVSDCASLPLSTFYPGQSCSDIPCDMNPTLGACCYEDPDLGWTCVETDELKCLQSFGGVWYAGQPCSWIDCPAAPPTGACCYDDPDLGTLTCTDNVDEIKCLQVFGGTWHPSLTCVDIADECMDPRGACCFQNPDDGSYDCIDNVTEFECVEYYNGIWTGGATCAEVDCCPKLGACCIKDVCVQTTTDSCDAAGGTWMGMGLSCDQADCPEPCIFDVTGDGLVNFSDLIAIINNWGLVCP